MKTYNNLLKPMLSPKGVATAMIEASKYKKKRRSVVSAFCNFDTVYPKVVNSILDPNYYPDHNNKSRIMDGTKNKIRIIEKPAFCPEQIIHHIIIMPFKRIVLNGLYEHVYGSLPPQVKKSPDGKEYVQKYGADAAAKVLKKWVQVNKKIYVAELDIQKAYDSVNLYILMQKLKEVIKDEAWLNLVNRFLRGKWNKDRGLVLGNYTSPWFFHFYLKEFDHFAASFKDIKYLRYADNFFLVCTNKRKLRNAVYILSRYLYDNLRLLLNRSSQIYRFEYVDRTGKVRGRAVNALGFIIHRNRVTIRKSILRGIRRKALRINRKGEAVNWYDATSMLSRLNWFRKTDSFTYYTKYVKPLINIPFLKNKVREFSRKIVKFMKYLQGVLYVKLANSIWFPREQTE